MNLRWYHIAIVLLVIYSPVSLYAQGDTTRVFHYNLLNYGNSANPESYKSPRLQRIIQFANPDIISLNEIANQPQLIQNIANILPGNNWKHGTYSNANNQQQINMLYWREDKFVLVEQKTISTRVRDILAFKLYYNDSLLYTNDTIFLTVIVAHFKASNTLQDRNTRADEATDIISYIQDSLKITGNYLLAGDLNLYTSQELAYQYLTDSSNVIAAFYDPVNRPGAWHNDSTYTVLHTQSTREASMGDGGASGGSDDRFDFILCSKPIIIGTKNIAYIQGSYNTLGQDGRHFNRSITDTPYNTQLPAAVINDLYELSDHMPVYADFVFTPKTISVSLNKTEDFDDELRVINPFNDVITVYITKNLERYPVELELYNSYGSLVSQKDYDLGMKNLELRTTDLSPGLYILKIHVNGTDYLRMLNKL